LPSALRWFLVLHPEKMYLFPFMIGIPLVFGVMMIIPIAGRTCPR